MSFGTARIMFNAGGSPGTADRREADLYVTVEDVDAVYARLRSSCELKQDLHDTFYGMREFIVRDPDGFWVTFGAPTDGGVESADGAAQPGVAPDGTSPNG